MSCPAGQPKPADARCRPTPRLLIAADNDHHTKARTGTNPGLKAATEAATESQAEIITPPLAETETGTDWNDYANQHGEARARAMLVEKSQAGMLSVLWASDLEALPVPQRQWLLKDWIPLRETTALYGDGGVGKTLIAQQLIPCVATGLPFFGLMPERGTTPGIFCEDGPDELHLRQAQICAGLGVSLGTLGHRLGWVSRKGKDNLLMIFDKDVGRLTPIWGELAQVTREIRPRLLVVTPHPISGRRA